MSDKLRINCSLLVFVTYLFVATLAIWKGKGRNRKNCLGYFWNVMFHTFIASFSVLAFSISNSMGQICSGNKLYILVHYHDMQYEYSFKIKTMVKLEEDTAEFVQLELDSRTVRIKNKIIGKDSGGKEIQDSTSYPWMASLHRLGSYLLNLKLEQLVYECFFIIQSLTYLWNTFVSPWCVPGAHFFLTFFLLFNDKLCQI